ncbi:DNA/RNA non-specific endonuclease [Kocuria sp. LHG3120]|uniref:DNA/RNA non-specific endonuclease n=1 Tax=Kocuria sp. LHG3120 TaxID=2804590 RepID=UPI003CEC69EA
MVSIPDRVIAATVQRYQARQEPRATTVDKIRFAHMSEGHLLAVDAPDRVRMRSEHLLQQPVVRAALGVASTESAAAARGVIDDPRVLERIIGDNNLLGVAFLELGAAAARSVGRIHIREGSRPAGFGTGFLVSPRLAMTNNHVLENVEVARSSWVEFNFQDGIDGMPLRSRFFALDPAAFFLTDPELDCTVVAVAAQSLAQEGSPSVPLHSFGFHRTSAVQGKILLGESVNIIQHPEGKPKQISLQQNELVDRLELFLHYRSDTAPGSSGSPLYNNQWEVLGLHHSGVPAQNEAGQILAQDGTVWTHDRGEAAIQWVANEGVRMSSIHTWLRTAATTLAPAARQLLEELLTPPPPPATTPAEHAAQAPEGITVPVVPVPSLTPTPEAKVTAAPAQQLPVAPPQVSQGTVSLTVPLHLELRLDSPTTGIATSSGAGIAPAEEPEAQALDPDYDQRPGYDPDFLPWPVPLPPLTDAQRTRAAQTLRARPGADPTVVDYHHFSLVVDAPRRLALYTAVNVDGARARRPDRDDRWLFDPRLMREVQIGNELYSRNDFDRGHLVRRLDPAWGSVAEACKGNDDTFHYTNCAPQHSNFNQNTSTWLGLEDYLLNQARADRSRITVFTGPVLEDTDPIYRGHRIPLAFWKILAFQHTDGQPSATAYLISQRDLVTGITKEAFVPTTHQVAVRRIRDLTGLDFAYLTAADPLDEPGAEHERAHEAFEERLPSHLVGSFDDLVL